MKVHDGGALKDIVKGILTELAMVVRLALAKARQKDTVMEFATDLLWVVKMAELMVLRRVLKMVMLRVYLKDTRMEFAMDLL